MVVSADKLRLQEELFRIRTQRRETESRRENLVNRARMLQARAAQQKTKVASLGKLSPPRVWEPSKQSYIISGHNARGDKTLVRLEKVSYFAREKIIRIL